MHLALASCEEQSELCVYVCGYVPQGHIGIIHIPGLHHLRDISRRALHLYICHVASDTVKVQKIIAQERMLCAWAAMYDLSYAPLGGASPTAPSL